MTELFPLDHLGRFPCRSLNHLLQRHPHIHHGGDHVQHILHTAIIASGVNICAQCVGSQTLFESRNGHLIEETASSEADIENDPTLLGFQHPRPQLPPLIHHSLPHSHPPAVHVRIDISRAQPINK